MCHEWHSREDSSCNSLSLYRVYFFLLWMHPFPQPTGSRTNEQLTRVGCLFITSIHPTLSSYTARRSGSIWSSPGTPRADCKSTSTTSRWRPLVNRRHETRCILGTSCSRRWIGSISVEAMGRTMTSSMRTLQWTRSNTGT